MSWTQIPSMKRHAKRKIETPIPVNISIFEKGDDEQFALKNGEDFNVRGVVLQNRTGKKLRVCACYTVDMDELFH